MGAETARQIAKAGASVTIMGRTKKSLLEQNLPYEVCDVTDREAVKEAFNAARLARGPITVWLLPMLGPRRAYHLRS